MNCNVCHKIYGSKSDSRSGLEDEAIDDGWEILEYLGSDGSGNILSTHICKECAIEAKVNGHM